jgi:hypothetical protein
MLGDIRGLTDAQLCDLITIIGQRIWAQGNMITSHDATELAQIETEMQKRAVIRRLAEDGFWEGDREGTA